MISEAFAGREITFVDSVPSSASHRGEINWQDGSRAWSEADIFLIERFKDGERSHMPWDESRLVMEGGTGFLFDSVLPETLGVKVLSAIGGNFLFACLKKVDFQGVC